MPSTPVLEGSTREKILAAAHTVFLRHGITAATTQEIAAEAGVNKALIHYYFGTKEMLANTVLKGVHERVFPTIFGILSDPGRELNDRVRDAIELQLRTFCTHPYLPGFVATEIFTNAELVSKLLDHANSPSLKLLQDQLDLCVATGQIRATRAEQFVMSIFGATIMPFIMRPVFEHTVFSQAGDFEKFIEVRRESLADFFLNGLRP